MFLLVAVCGREKGSTPHLLYIRSWFLPLVSGLVAGLHIEESPHRKELLLSQGEVLLPIDRILCHMRLLSFMKE
jgi:hypothetical protein